MNESLDLTLKRPRRLIESREMTMAAITLKDDPINDTEAARVLRVDLKITVRAEAHKTLLLSELPALLTTGLGG